MSGARHKPHMSPQSNAGQCQTEDVPTVVVVWCQRGQFDYTGDAAAVPGYFISLFWRRQ